MTHIHELNVRNYCMTCLLSVGDLVDEFNSLYLKEKDA